MRALYWNGVNDLRVGTVKDPEIVNPRDAILKVRLSTTCGSDLHFIDGYIPSMKAGDVIGHEFMGEVVEVGTEVRQVKKGDRVVVPSFIACGECWYCQEKLFSLCDCTHPKPELQEPLLGYPTAGIYGYTHAFGGYAGSHAEYIRVPHADVDCFKVPDGVADETALFLSDAAPTGYMGADFCGIRPGDTVAVWGCGGVGLMAQQSARLMGAERVIAIDRFPERLRMAREHAGSETLDYTQVHSVLEALKEMTGGRGPDACIDAVGMEAHGTGSQYAYDRVKQALRLETDRGQALREAVMACCKGGTLSVLGVYGMIDKFPMGVIMNKGMTLRTAQQHGQAYMDRLLTHVAKGELNPAYLATHRFSLEDGPRGYDMFKHKTDGCVRAVFAP
ncbi:zinc-dependent alcohol dehydrogenase (plasmid) [Methylobacterium radiotolerans]|jgi:threonine dehydrogenase-like Zn-dependent dehydrogenase|uniref:zinc-dependent alcohol dehydrogenase n=1 Tax=Methylobacterium TaxID=407 RepID=UPI0005E78AB1|nr:MULTISPECIES: zinc-dependent alcohol dehydrogenase [Methylobacterium]MBN6819822.1 glutathione-dependent formaldehyde dehydrogenase [Methylobacterium organophilum]OXE43038.1 glutathione-dependent formaldehyde dehydrogenase [Methylobacterium radiotolerans]UIY45410.1 glutathione-dependent formaldehyde dehydrogenase [Methylobacterium radiotolerans]GAN48735.1 S-(hydroxymethyl)glutathione dehydrogenase [Methylobacterium sp. ME121]